MEKETNIAKSVGEHFGYHLAGRLTGFDEIDAAAILKEAFSAATTTFYDLKFHTTVPHSVVVKTDIPPAIAAVAAILADEYRRRYENKRTTSPAAFVNSVEEEIILPLFAAICSNK